MSTLHVRLFGSLQVTHDDQPIIEFRSDKVRALLAYLILETDHPHSRDTLAGLLWPNMPDQQARNNLRLSLHRLRSTLGDTDVTSGFLQVSPDTVQFNGAASTWLDVITFTSLLAECEHHPHRRLAGCASCMAKATDAVELYRGDLLQGFFVEDCLAFTEWLWLKREWLRRQAVDTLYHLAEYHQRRGAPERVLYYAHLQLELEPWREEAHRQIMIVLAQRGDRSAAVAQYVACCRILADELSVEPARETTALYEQIKAGTIDTSLIDLSTLHNLPVSTQPFVGRENEVAQITRLIESTNCRLITLVGPGGVGKTQLALQVAAHQIGAFDHGVYFVPLAPINSPELMATAITGALKVALTGQTDPRAQLLNTLRDSDLLLVLDNFEHLLAGVDLLIDIVRTAPGVTILVTSREPLNLQSEWVVDISGLPFPPGNEGIEAYSAVTLFVQQARRIRQDFALTATNVQAVAQICRLVEGMPLALELSAALTRTLSCTDIAQAIVQNLRILATTMRDVPERHHSLRGVFDQSWRLLSDNEQLVLRRLAVFRGDFSITAAEQVTDATAETLAVLNKKSLLRRYRFPDGRERYDLHELIRQYAHERMFEDGENQLIAERHLHFFLRLAEEAEAQLQGAEQESWLKQLEWEHDNLRAALDWTQSNPAFLEMGLHLAVKLSRFWLIRGHISEGRGRLENLLALSRTGESGVADDRREGEGTLSFWQARARALQSLGVLSWKTGDYVAAQAAYTDSLPLFQKLGDQRGVAHQLGNLAILASSRGEYAEARSLYGECSDILRTLGDKRGTATVLYNSAILAKRQGEFATARALLEELLPIRQELADRRGIALAQNVLSDMLRRQGDGAAAHTLALASLRFFDETEDKPGLIECMDVIAGIFYLQARFMHAAQLLGAASRLREDLGEHITPSDRAEYDQLMADLRQQLGDAVFDSALAEGRGMPVEQAMTIGGAPL